MAAPVPGTMTRLGLNRERRTVGRTNGPGAHVTGLPSVEPTSTRNGRGRFSTVSARRLAASRACRVTATLVAFIWGRVATTTWIAIGR